MKPIRQGSSSFKSMGHSVSGGKGLSEGADVCLPTCKPAVRRALQWVWQ